MSMLRPIVLLVGCILFAFSFYAFSRGEKTFGFGLNLLALLAIAISSSIGAYSLKNSIERPSKQQQKSDQTAKDSYQI